MIFIIQGIPGSNGKHGFSGKTGKPVRYNFNEFPIQNFNCNSTISRGFLKPVYPFGHPNSRPKNIQVK